MRDRAKSRRRPACGLPIHGSDKLGRVLSLAQANLAATGLAESITLKQVDVLESRPPEAGGVLIMNPPYGERLADSESLARLYPRLGDVLKKRYAGWTAHILSADMRLPKLIGLKPSRRTPLYNGALECRLFEFRLVAGSMRRHQPV